MSAVETEHVLVVPAALLKELGYFQGFHNNTEGYRNTASGFEALVRHVPPG